MLSQSTCEQPIAGVSPGRLKPVRNIRLIAILVAFLAATPSQAATITLSPSAATIAIGGSVTVDVNISGLGAGVVPSLSAFDLELTFNDTLLGWTGITFGDPGGDQLDLDAFGPITAYDDSTAGTLFFSELSFDSQTSLENDQLGSFRLAQLTFQGLSGGLATLAMPNVILLDAIGDPISLDAAVSSLNIEVVVPVPAAAWLFASALGLLSVRRRRVA